MSLPVTLMVPAPISKLTSTVAAAVELHRKPALVARLALWQRRPAGVVCVEQADVQLAPVAVYVEQQHAMQLAEFLGGLAASTEAAAAAATSPSASSQRPARSRGGTAGAAAAAGGEGSVAGALSGSRAASEASFHASGPSGAAVGGAAAALVPPLQLNAAGLGAVATPMGTRLPGLPADLEALLSGQGSALLAPAEQKVRFLRIVQPSRLGPLPSSVLCALAVCLAVGFADSWLCGCPPSPAPLCEWACKFPTLLPCSCTLTCCALARWS